jgi:hypothetical protein
MTEALNPEPLLRGLHEAGVRHIDPEPDNLRRLAQPAVRVTWTSTPDTSDSETSIRTSVLFALGLLDEALDLRDR